MDELGVNAEKNIKAGFRKCGIVPLDSSQVLTRLPMQEEKEEEKIRAVSDSFTKLLKDMRYGSMNIREPKKKRKLEVVAGKSVSAEEVEVNEDQVPVKPKKPRNQKKIDESTPKLISLKGKGIGKKTKSSGDKLQTDNGQNKKISTKICEVPERSGLNGPADVVSPEDPFDFPLEDMPIIFVENVDDCQEIIVMKTKISKVKVNKTMPKKMKTFK